MGEDDRFAEMGMGRHPEEQPVPIVCVVNLLRELLRSLSSPYFKVYTCQQHELAKVSQSRL